VKALGDIRCRDAVPFVVECLLSDSDSTVKRSAVEALGKLNWKPTNDKASALYWDFKGDIEKCAACGINAIEPLLTRILNGSYEAMDAFAKLGQPALEILMACSTMILKKYNNLTSSTHELNFMLDSDHVRSEMIEQHVDKLGYCSWAIGKFNTLEAELYLEQLYEIVKTNIYSDPEGGFSDMFRAVNLRRNIVGAFTNIRSKTSLQFTENVLESDRADFVRWEALDVLRKRVSEIDIEDKKIKTALTTLIADLQTQLKKNDLNVSGQIRLKQSVDLLNKIEQQNTQF
jgi:HEAT repeat protein